MAALDHKYVIPENKYFKNFNIEILPLLVDGSNINIVFMKYKCIYKKQ